MHQTQKLLSFFVAFLIVCTVLLPERSASATERGALTGGAPHEAPNWFKDSFLEIAGDVEEAGEANKHVMLFFQLNDCPYCDRMLVESFESEPHKGFIQTHFDVIAINVRGDRDVVFNDELEMTEKELSEHLNVFATPAIVFLNSDNEQIVRVNGYRSPERFQKTLDYVSARAYEDTKFSDFVAKSMENSVYALRDHKVFSPVSDMSAVTDPLMVILENSSCYECAEFHDNLLAREDIVDELNKFTVVRLDTDSNNTFIDVDGVKSTPGEIADKYNMTFRPGVLMFDGGKLISRFDSLLYSYHFREGVRYVGGGFYKKEDRRTYSQRRREELLNAGIDIDLAK